MVPPTVSPSGKNKIKSRYAKGKYRINCSDLHGDLHPYNLLLYVSLSGDGHFHIPLPRNLCRAVRDMVLYMLYTDYSL